MIKVAIFPLGLYVKPQQQRTINAFAKLGVSKLALLWNWIPLPFFLRRFQRTYLPAVFDSYREGKITDEQFRQTADLFVSKLDKDDFDSAWNAQCDLSYLNDYAKKAFDEAQQLIERGMEVYFFSGTNPLHIASIEKQYGKAIPGIHFFSYEQRKLNNALTQALLTEIKDKHPDILPNEIAFFYSKPVKPYPKLGVFAQFWAPFQYWFYKRAVRDVANLQSLTAGKVTLVEQPKTKTPDILTTLEVDLKPITTKVSAASRQRPILIRRNQQQSTLRQDAGQKEVITSKKKKEELIITKLK